MSLLDDVSIVVTPNGYKAGELYAVVPVPTEGADVVVCGDFSCAVPTDSWTFDAGWSVVGDKLKSVNGGNYTVQNNVFEANKNYKITYTISDYSSGGFHTWNASSGATTINNSNGTYTEYINFGSSTNLRIYLRGDGSFNGSIDNISVKEYTSADMDVTRATAGTRVDEDGLVNYAEILGSELVPSIITTEDNNGGVINYISGNIYSSTSDGTSTSTIRPKFNFNTTSGKTYKLVITPTGTITGTVNFDFHNGSSYLFSNYDFTTTKEIYFTDNGNVFGAFDGTQIYNITGFTISVKEAARDNVPRIDYTGGGCPHILAEPQRTNLVTYSEDFSNAFWVKNNVTVTPNTTISPDGELTADKVLNSTGNNHLYHSFVVTNGINYTYSIYIKRIDEDVYKLNIFNSGYTENLKVLFNIVTETITVEDGVTGTSYIGSNLESLSNDWFRIDVTFNSFDTTLHIRNYIGESTGTNGASIYYWGAQLEVGSYPTSYIPNFGTSSGVTRNQDIFTRDGIGSLINDSEGVLFSEVYFEQTGLTNGLFAISDGTFNNILMVRYSPINKLQIESTGGVNIIESSARSSGTYKIAVKYDSNGVELWVDGNKISETSTQSTMSGINELMLGKSPYGNIVGCKVKQLQVYNTALTDEQLLQLTGESGTDFYESYAEMAAALTYTIQ